MRGVHAVEEVNIRCGRTCKHNRHGECEIRSNNYRMTCNPESKTEQKESS